MLWEFPVGGDQQQMELVGPASERKTHCNGQEGDGRRREGHEAR